MKSAFILDILRTPVGKYGGALASVRPDDLAALAIRKLIERNPVVDVNLIEDVIFGAANQAGEDNRNVARMALLLAELPITVAGVTVNRLCASGMEAIVNASRAIRCNEGQFFIAGGVESMSRSPFVMAKQEQSFSRRVEVYDTTIGWRFTNPALSKLYYPFSMGETAENVAERYSVKRTEQDEFALGSQEKYARANAAGWFEAERIPVTFRSGSKEVVVDKDEHPRETTLEKLASLRPAFRENGTVTAGNSSGINDGAAACIICDEATVRDLNLAPMVRIVSHAVAGVDPSEMGMGPVPAVRKALGRAGLSMNDIGRVELNEAFASQAIACMRVLGIAPEIVNVNGGAIAIGHPLGCSGVRISATLIHEMKRSKTRFGLATMCVGVGQGEAIIFELC